MADEKVERERVETPAELTPEDMDQATGGVQGPPIKGTDSGGGTHIPGNPI